ncbi:SusC/RagA family TonB-linked outer membrane protein [Salegentibacter sp. BLCTC]|uniref:TonB-linked outer membrane protein, SusC/RagA family n=1 Tax=Salegentibacter echinorum TaxID=1073325 RepID=A0A1M5FQ77_SALEC|nr:MULTISPECIES: TonB-dependent receptor [Salegentibacter]MBE7639101.1 SusC/RagA family TonB-linked outer membrane protein [Salegentibacter sp. BLCTC]SHF93653.1 TonB-linked outer membrane protein, SusC/RagA family [Salegentibacter echinorum]
MIKKLCSSYGQYRLSITMGCLLAFFGSMQLYAVSKIDSSRDFVDKIIQKAINGQVTDQNGMSLPGVNVQVKGKETVVVTDFDGNYSISAVTGDVLVFSFIGMKTTEKKVGDLDIMNITLEEDTSELDEVVVVGYGTKAKTSVTGAVEVITAEEIASRPSNNVLSTLQGMVPGATITRSGGQPGREGLNINLRGISSVNGGNSPLILVDGNPVNDFNTINPKDIKSMSFLKDASAAIYGSRAAGGVVLITTKSGKKGKPSVSLNAFSGISSVLNKIEYPTMIQYALMHREADINNGVSPFWNDERIERIEQGSSPVRLEGSPEFQFFESTDWVDELYGTGIQQDYNLSINGGGDNSNYYYSVGYNKTDGMLEGAPDVAERFNIRGNYSFNISDNLKIDTRLTFERLQTEELYSLERVVNSVRLTPIFFPVKTQSGENWFSQWGYSNPVAMAREGAPLERWTNRFLPNLTIDWEFLNNLKVVAQAGLTFENFDSRRITTPISYHFWDDKFAYNEYATFPNNANYGFSKTNQRNYSARLEYNNTFNDIHELSVMAGATHDEYDTSSFSAYRDNFISDELFTLNLGDKENMSNNGGGYHWALQSLISRLNYNYKGKYFAEANFRYDGSSRFIEDQRWKLFSSVQAAWRLSEESFIKSLDFFDNLKLRVSYGELGNQSGIGLYDYVQNINIGGQYPFGDTQRAQSATLAGMVSTNRTWETLIARNIGVDANIFDNRMNVSFDYYKKTNKNMLVGVTLPSVLGATPPFTNNGELDSWGWELSLGWQDQINDFQYGANLVLSNSDNKVTNLGGFDNYAAGLNGVREGYRTNLYYGFDFDGIIQDQATLDAYKQLDGVPANIDIGDAMYRDVDGNGRIDAYSDERENGDLVILGTTDPQYSFGINMNAKYKGFDFSAFLQGVGKRTVFREHEARVPFNQPWYHPPALFYNNTWAPERPDAKYPRISHSNIRDWNFAHSSNNKENGAYIRLKNIQLGYSLSDKVLESIGGIQNLRVYVSANDIWDYHELPGGYDPEDNSWGSNYPFAKTMAVGLDVTF